MNLLEGQEMCQHVHMKYNNKFYLFIKSLHLTIYGQIFVIYFDLTIFCNLETRLQNY